MSEACSTCNAPLVFGITPAGRRAPIDRLATPNGNVILTRPAWLHNAGEVLAVTLSGDALTLARRVRVPLHLNHWASCPDKEEWRQRQRVKRERAA